MDQACAFGNKPVKMIYDGDNLECLEVAIGKPFYYLIVDLGFSGKSTTKILQGLQSAYPFPEDERQKNVHALFGKFNLRITEEAITALRQGDALKLGQLMNTAQAEFDLYAKPLCPEQLSMPILHSLLDHPSIQPYIFGGKGVGSQGDGTAQLLCKNEESLTILSDIIKKEFTNMEAIPLTLSPTCKIRKR